MIESPLLRAPDEKSGGSYVGAHPSLELARDPVSHTRRAGKPLGALAGHVPTAQVRGDAAAPVLDVSYRSSEVVNFANAATATYAAYMYSGLRRDGHLFLPPLHLREGRQGVHRRDLQVEQLFLPGQELLLLGEEAISRGMACCNSRHRR